MANDKKEMSEEDYLKRHLTDLEVGKSMNSDIPGLEGPKSNASRIDDLNFFNIDVRELPCGMFYPTGTLFMIRAAQLIEIQSYSMVDDNNFHDIVEKMNSMLQSCVRIKYPDGRIGSYLETKDQDRLYLIFLIRELTFQEGTNLAITVECECKTTSQIELKRSNFAYHEVDKKLNNYFNESTKTYQFRTINGKEFEITPPNIGLQKAFTDFIIKENQEKRVPNLSFLKIIPFMLPGRTSITYEGIKAKLREYEDPNNMDDISFQFLNSAITKMVFGIKELVKKCPNESCGEEIHTEMRFPNGASSIFVVQDAFEAYIEK